MKKITNVGNFEPARDVMLLKNMDLFMSGALISTASEPAKDVMLLR